MSVHGPWLLALVKLTDALLTTAGQEMDDCRTTAALLRLLLLYHLSSNRQSRPELKELCESLFIGVDCAFTYKIVASECVQFFCRALETFPEYYILEMNCLKHYFTIASHQHKSETKMALKSLRSLMQKSSAVQKVVAEFICNDMNLQLLNLIYGGGNSIVQETFELLIEIQEYLGPDEGIFEKAQLGTLFHYMSDHHRRIRVLAIKFCFMSSSTKLKHFLKSLYSYEVS